MRNSNLGEILLAKYAYERFLSSFGVTAKAYHADNDRFADQGFQNDCNLSNQVITFFLAWVVIIKTGLRNKKSRRLLLELGLYCFMLNGCYQNTFPQFSGLLHQIVLKID
jgi:hypothetical protein